MELPLRNYNQVEFLECDHDKSPWSCIMGLVPEKSSGGVKVLKDYRHSALVPLAGDDMRVLVPEAALDAKPGN